MLSRYRYITRSVTRRQALKEGGAMSFALLCRRQNRYRDGLNLAPGTVLLVGECSCSLFSARISGPRLQGCSFSRGGYRRWEGTNGVEWAHGKPSAPLVGGPEVPSQKKAGGGKEQGSSLKLRTTPAGPHMCQETALGSDWALGRPSNLPLMHQPTSHHDLTSNQQPSASLCFCMHTRHPGPQRLQP